MNLPLVIILVIFISIVLMLIISKPKKKIVKQKIRQDINESLPNVYKINLPKQINKINDKEITNIAKKVYDIFLKFSYKDLDLVKLDKKEWHTWQVSILLMMYKHNKDLYIPKPEFIFHKFFINSSDEQIKTMMKSILKKYKMQVNILYSRDILSKEFIWTSRDMSIIFYFLSKYKTYKK